MLSLLQPGLPYMRAKHGLPARHKNKSNFPASSAPHQPQHETPKQSECLASFFANILIPSTLNPLATRRKRPSVRTFLCFCCCLKRCEVGVPLGLALAFGAFGIRLGLQGLWIGMSPVRAFKSVNLRMLGTLLGFRKKFLERPALFDVLRGLWRFLVMSCSSQLRWPT